MRKRVLAGLSAVASVVAGTAMLGAGVASASGGWVIQSTYEPPHVNQQYVNLRDVSCPAVNACVSIGDAGSKKFLTESWNGTTWSPLLTPYPPGGGELGGLSCTSGSACVAAGFTDNSSGQSLPLVETWNGTSWQQQSVSAPPDAGFAGVSCPSPQFCVAVGNYSTAPDTSTTLAEAWNGTTWSVQPMPAAGNAGLRAVSCPTTSYCTAVGEKNNGKTVITESWNGTAWTIQKTPDTPAKEDPQLASVSCATASSCTAIGNYVPAPDKSLKVLFEHWNGTGWVRQSISGKANSSLFAVSCASATSCTAVGGSWAAQWNGTTWAPQKPATPPGAVDHTFILYGVSCPAAGVCETVGFFHAKSPTSRFRDVTLIEAS
jgi:hypothetical protein